MTTSNDPYRDSRDELVARALGTTAVDADRAAERVLSRIGGRSPRTIADETTNARLRSATAIALTVLATLCWFPAPALERGVRPNLDVTVLAVDDPDDSPAADGTRPGDLVSELFTLSAEAPE